MPSNTGQLGTQARTQGALLVEGSWYCPALPELLITATADLRGHTIDPATYDAQIAARAAYQLKRKDGPDADGYERAALPRPRRPPGPGSQNPSKGPLAPKPRES